MKTRKLILTVFAVVFAIVTTFASSYEVDKSASSVKWHGKKVTGEHYGTISFSKGHFVSDDGKITGGEFVIDMNSIVNEDLTDESWNQKLIGHLKSDDFFSVEKYPTSKLVLKNVSLKSGDTHVFKGHLTIKGITKPVEFEADVHKHGDSIHATGTMVIDRTLYDIKYGSGKFFAEIGDKMIYDDFTLKFDLTATK